MAAHKYGRCLYKGNCELNCQVFVSEDDTNVAMSSLCFACKHLAAFHEQVVSVPVASSTRPAFANAKVGRENYPRMTAVTKMRFPVK